MPKKLRKERIYIASQILGWLDENDDPHVFDERSLRNLNPTNIEDKIVIYQRQVNDWFLIPATNLSRHKNKNKGFIVLMICLSYLEGIEQYRRGQRSNGNSGDFFVSAINKIYPNKYQNTDLNDFYKEARCGLFHNGMVGGRIIIDNQFSESLEFQNGDIKINTKKFLEDIKIDFQNYLNDLQVNQQLRQKFDHSYSNI